VADSGRSIFLEPAHRAAREAQLFSLEIPYGYIHRIEEVSEPQPDAAAEPAPELPDRLAAAAGAAQAPPETPSILRLPRRPKPPELLSFPTPQRRIGYNLLAFAR